MSLKECKNEKMIKLSVQIEFDKTIHFSITKKSFIIGRSSQSDIVIPHSSISRSHCKVESNKNLFYITDLGSTNGIMIDQQKITPHQKTLFSESSTLSLGGLDAVLTHGEHFSKTTPLPMESLEASPKLKIPKKEGTEVTFSKSRIDLQRPRSMESQTSRVTKSFIQEQTLRTKKKSDHKVKKLKVVSSFEQRSKHKVDSSQRKNPFFLYVVILCLGSALFMLKNYFSS